MDRDRINVGIEEREWQPDTMRLSGPISWARMIMAMMPQGQEEAGGGDQVPVTDDLVVGGGQPVGQDRTLAAALRPPDLDWPGQPLLKWSPGTSSSLALYRLPYTSRAAIADDLLVFVVLFVLVGRPDRPAPSQYTQRIRLKPPFMRPAGQTPAMYCAYQSGQFGSGCPVSASCLPCAASARRSASARAATEP